MKATIWWYINPIGTRYIIYDHNNWSNQISSQWLWLGVLHVAENVTEGELMNGQIREGE